MVDGSRWRTQAPRDGGGGDPGATLEWAFGVGTPLTRTSWVTGPKSSVELFHDTKIVPAVTEPRVNPLGVDGGVVSASVVTFSGALYAWLYWKSEAITRNE